MGQDGQPPDNTSRDSHGWRPRWTTLALIAIVLLAFLLRVYPLEEYHGWDESSYLQHAAHMAYGKDNFDEFMFRPPVLPIILAIGMRVSDSPFMPGVIIALLAAAISIPAFFIGRRLANDDAGIFAALLFALHPGYILNGHLILTDAIVATFLAVALAIIVCAPVKGRDTRRWADILPALLAGILAGIAGLTKFTALATPPAFLLYLLIARNNWRERTMHCSAFVAGWAIIVLPYLLWARTRFGSAFAPFSHAQSLMTAKIGTLAAYFGTNTFTMPLLIGLLVLAIVSTWSTILYARGRSRDPFDARWNAFIALTLAWTIILFAYISPIPVREARYALPVILPLVILASVGWALLAHALPGMVALRRIFLVVFIVGLCASSFSRLEEPAINRWVPPAVDMAQRITADNRGDTIYATSHYPVFGYYSDMTVVVVDGPRFLDAYPRIMPRDGYLVLAMDGTREPTIAWADAQEALSRMASNDGFVVYRYTRSLAR